MKLRAQSLWFLIGATLGAFALVAGVGVVVLLPSADDADRHDLGLRLERLQSRIHQQLEQVRIYAHEYGPWTDTAAFIRDQNPEYIEANFGEDPLSGSGMSVVAIWDENGKYLISRSYDPITETVEELPPSIVAALKAWPGLAQKTVGQSREGILSTPAGPLLVSAQPVTENDRTPPSRGTFLAGQFLDQELLERLSSGENHTVALHSAATFPDAPAVRFADRRTMLGLLALRDSEERLIGGIEITARRHSRLVQERSLWLVFGTLCGGGVLLIALMWRLVSRRFLHRIEELTRDVAHLENDEHRRRKLARAPGDDELAQLARDTGAMAVKLADARETAEAATRAKGAFLAAMSHEIRTPLNGVLGYLGLLRDTGLTAEQREHLRVIEESGEGLLGVINEILDYSKLESGRVELEALPTDVRTLCGEVLALFTPRLRAKQVRNMIEVDAAAPARIYTDPLRLRQVLTNLISNAEKFTASGEVVVRIEPLVGLEPGLRIAVRDTGIGLSAEQRERVFTPFNQADRSTTRRFGGTGLGLAICERLVRAWGGCLTVESEVGRGSTFAFTIPARTVAPGEAEGAHAPELATSDASTAPLAPLRILIAEDNAVNARLLLAILQKFGQTARHVVDGRQALVALEQGAYDLVLMDVQMPEHDGLEVAKIHRLREQRGGLSPVLIAALTANALAGAREECLAAGMDDYLAKPFRPEQLRRILELAAARRTATRKRDTISEPIG